MIVDDDFVFGPDKYFGQKCAKILVRWLAFWRKSIFDMLGDGIR
jgi:hypothetical protein